MDYNQPYGAGAGAAYVNGNPATGVAGSIPPAAAIEYPQREIVGIIADCGLTPDNANLHQLALAVQGGQLNYANDTGTAGNVVVTLPRAPTAYVAGFTLRVKIANRNSGAAVINVNGLGNVSILRHSGVALSPGDLIVGNIEELVFDGAAFRITSPAGTEVPISVASPTLYVRTDGNDNNDGSANDSSHAFATIQAALNAAANRLNLTGRTLTIVLGLAGTYVGGSIGSIPSVLITSAGPESSFIINNSGLPLPQGAMNVAGGALTLNNVTLSNTNNSTHTLQASFGGSIRLTGTVAFGGTAGASGVADMRCFAGGSISASGTVKFNRNVGYAMYAQGSGANINFLVGSNIVCNAVNWVNAGVAAIENGTIELAGNAPTGTAFGTRYNAATNGVINAFAAGASYFPGNAAGTTSTGGQYV